jgi:MFS family permease
MPVLFKEISDDLGLSLLQVGTIWGMLGLASLITGLAFGLITDRFGTRLTLGTFCLLQGIAGALRGISGGFTSLAIVMLLFGFFCVPLTFATHKAAGEWFSGRQLGLANGILAMGIGVGATVGSMISATVLSPLFGGWRNLMFVFGAIAVVISLLWFQSRRNPYHEKAASSTGTVPFRQALSHVIHIRAAWLLILAQMCIAGSRAGFSGYLPLHLRLVGWPPVNADGAMATLSAVSVVGVIPLSLLSDRLGLRKVVMYPAILLTIIGLGLLSVFTSGIVWLAVIMVGIFQELLAAIMITMIMETEGIGTVYAGTALGLSTSVSGLGGFFSPPLGNGLAEINQSFAFIFWAAIDVAALFIFYFVRETGWKKQKLSWS